MFSRNTFHDCAHRLSSECHSFRIAVERYERGDSSAMQDMRTSSTDGYTTLRAIALSVRPEADYGLIPDDGQTVGKIINNATETEIEAVVQNPDCDSIDSSRFSNLTLREALHKIAHADPNRDKSGFKLTDDDHRIILTGQRQNGRRWISITSLPLFASIVRDLPDHQISQG